MEEIKILLVEDHLLVREGIHNLIEEQDGLKTIGEASNGKDALHMAELLHPDVVLMDISLPDINGIEITKKIKELYPSISVLILTAYDNEEFVIAALEANASGYLLKDVGGAELIKAIGDVSKGKSILHPSVTKTVINYLHESSSVTKPSPSELLSVRELEVISLGAKGLVNKEIAHRLNLSDRTIQSHWRNIFVKLAVSSRMEAVLYCLKNELINLGSLDR